MLGTISDASGIVASAMTGLEELRQDVTERFEREEERAQQGHQLLKDELAGANLQARRDEAELIRNIDQRLARSLALATKESEERENMMTRREIERLVNDN